MKYIVINGNQFGMDFNVSLVASYDDLESAKACCQQNIAEDFGYGPSDFDEFKEEWGLDKEEERTRNPVYEISRYDDDSHEEIYKVYTV